MDTGTIIAALLFLAVIAMFHYAYIKCVKLQREFNLNSTGMTVLYRSREYVVGMEFSGEDGEILLNLKGFKVVGKSECKPVKK